MAVARNLSSLTDASAVLAAIAECADVGETEFLRRYGFDAARRYFVMHEGRSYPSKAVAGAAFGKEHPDAGPLKPSEFSGGREHTQRALERLGFVTAEIAMYSPSLANFQIAAMRARAEAIEAARETPSEERHRDVGRPGGEIKIPRPPKTPVATEYDPDDYGQGLVTHEQTRESLRQFLAARDIVWLEPAKDDPKFDGAWRAGEKFHVVEAKSLLGGEVAQLRRGIGQVIEYRHRVAAITGCEVVAVLAVSAEPKDSTWSAICADAGVLLAWPPWDQLRNTE